MDDELKAILQAMRTENAAAHAETRQVLRNEIKETAAAVRNEMKESAAAVRNEIKESATAVRNEMKETAGALRNEMKETAGALRNEMNETAAALRNEMKETATETRRHFHMVLEDFRDQIVGLTTDAVSLETRRIEKRCDDRASGLDYRITRLEARKR